MLRNFWNNIKLIFSNATILRRIAITFALLFVFKMGTFITIPLVDTTAITATIKGNNFLGFLNTFSGGGLGNFSILALGISPYITSSIVIEMLAMVFKPLKELQDQGEVGKQKINKIVRYFSVFLAFVQALALIFGLSSTAQNLFELKAIEHENMYVFYYIYMALVITAGSCFTIWLADLITQYGVGNGSSMIIAAGIITQIPAMFVTLDSKYFTEVTAGHVACYATILLLYILVILGVVYLEATVRKIPVQYANRSGNTDSNIPIKLNSASVIPVIFASTILSLPLTVLGLLGYTESTNNVAYWINQIFSTTNPIGIILYVILIYVFSFFYSFMQINPQKIAENLQNSNAFIPSIRPGDETANYVSRILYKVTLLGATYLAIVALIPILTAKIFSFTSAEANVITIGGTGLLIVVGVAVETMKQIETDANEQTYSGFID
jgi:preprotein translocase subunit SecY